MELSYNKTELHQEFIVYGKLDQESYGKFDSSVKTHYTKGLDVTLNVQNLEYISSVGLRSFIMLAKLVRSDKKNIYIKAKEGSMVKQLIYLSGFAKLMPFID
ncbi:MAG: STAS domain-containing protein [Bdellovibrionota bacterium]